MNKIRGKNEKLKSKNALMKPYLDQRANNTYQILKEKSMINKYTTPIFLILISLMNTPAYAEFKKAKTLMEKVKGGLVGLSTVTVILAIVWCGDVAIVFRTVNNRRY